LNLEPKEIAGSLEVWINQHCPATVDGTKSQQATVPHGRGWEGEESRGPSVRILGRQNNQTSFEGKEQEMKWSCLSFFVVGLLLMNLTFSLADGPLVQMEEVVVTGTRTREEIKNIPNAVVVLGAEEMASSSARNVGELLKETSMVDVTGYGYLGSAQSVSIRGSSASQVLIMIDGRPTNSITYGSADLSEIPLENVERIEIVKGPTSHLYGANAMGGVINVITKKPPDKPSFKAGISYGSFNTLTVQAEQGQTLDRFGYLLNAGSKSSDGYRDNSKYEAQDFSSKLTYQFLDRLNLSLLTVVHQDGLGVPGPKPAAGSSPPFGNSQVTSLFDHQDGKLFNNSLQMQWEPLDSLQVHWLGFQDFREIQYRQRYSGFPAAVEDHSTYRANIYGSSLEARWAFFKDHKLTLGTDFRHEGLEGEQQVKDLSTSVITDTRWTPDNTLWGFFAQEHWQVFSQWRLIGGLRYDHTSRYGSEVSPDLGLIYSPLERTNIKLHYGQAFRPPTFNDLFWPGAGNTQLSPEKGTSYEVNFDHALNDKKLVFSAGLFRWEVKDKIQWVPDATGIWQPQNVNEQNTWGCEVGIQWNPLKDLTFSLGYTYLDSIQKNLELKDALTNFMEMVERRAMAVPEHQALLTVGYQAPWQTRFNMNARYLGDRVFYYDDYSAYPTVNKLEKKITAYYTMDFKVTHPFGKHWEGTFSILNLTDQSYVEQAGTSFTDQDYPAPGRSIMAGVNYKF
jgi:outer membrane receptor for ferrienterochelin and colicins